MTGRLTAGAEWKALPGDSGELEGYASVFNVVDDGDDVVLPGAFKKTFSDWSRANQRMPLIADHQLSTDGVIGSVTHAAEDHHGWRLRAAFSSIAKAQDIRTKMIEGHLKGMSFTYDAIRHHRGVKDGRSVRFLDEVKVYEATVTPFPMNRFAVASAKGYPDDDLATLESLERWAAQQTAVGVLEELTSDPDAMIGVGTLLAQKKAVRDLAELERWAMSQPPRPAEDPGRPRPLSTAEKTHREAVSRSRFLPATRCWVCWKCQVGLPCSVYR